MAVEGWREGLRKEGGKGDGGGDSGGYLQVASCCRDTTGGRLK